MIGGYAFFNCISLETITSLAVIPPSIASSAFGCQVSEENENPQHVYETAIVRVPKEALEAYKADSGWGQFANLQELTSVIEAIEAETVRESDVIYDLRGMKATGRTPGIYIINGKKVLVR